MNLANRQILITGGARGLGRAFAEAVIRAGAEVLIADVLESGRDVARSRRPDRRNSPPVTERP